MKRLGMIALALALAASACSKSANNSNSLNTSNKNSSTTSTSNSSNTSSNSSTSLPPDSSSPSAVYKAAYEAAKRKDMTALKGLFSQKSLQDLDEAAREEGKTTDDLLRDSIDDPEDPLPATLEMRNEQINGDKATVEYKGSKGQWEKIGLVKEGGNWKLDIGNSDDTEGPAPTLGADDDEGSADDHGGH